MWGLVNFGLRIGAVLGLLLAAGSAGAAPAPADGASDWFVTDQGRVRLIAGATHTGAGDSVPLGLEFELAPHWKIYWRSPGDAGYPPHLDWTGSTNLRDAALGWPAPMRFSVLGLETVGYEGHVVLPIDAKLVHAGDALELRAGLQYLTCRDICVPYETKLALDIPAGPAGSSRHAAAIAEAVAKEPRREQTPELAVERATLVMDAAPMLELSVRSAPALGAPDAFIEGTDAYSFGAPKIARGAVAGATLLRIPLHANPGTRMSLAGKPLLITLVAGDAAIESRVIAMPGQAAPAFGGLLRIIGLALLGGFILNFMPCVLPVLALKLAHLVAHRGETRAVIRLNFLATAAGILVSFLILAGAMIVLQAAGLAIGWGIQFQQPSFLIFMMTLLTLFAANLWGLFEVPLPAFLSGLGGDGEGGGMAGSFAAGMLATLLATPCSAPFLGTAVGFALAAGPGEILAVFAALGLGLAAPYFLVALAPRLAAWMPRPGRWMLILRYVLGAALAATALWLAWVLGAESGGVVAIVVLALMAGVPLVLYWLRRLRTRGAAVAALVALAFFIPETLSAPPHAREAGGIWQPFDPAAIEKLVGAGKTVFVDVTADWCLTCKVNERLVIDTGEVRNRLSGQGIVAMRADWTRPDAKIARYLQGFGRYGIPFNAVYGPAAPAGVTLPELLTPDAVTSALDQAGKG